ncbi:hypothetical protein LK533_07380 [Sphingomonas sp. PL-96]|uniref:hypothetical protein n=1 Tax=Sphingomonas sp. PL-96 TaxID=2887201 RepID=UPI001E55CCC8|nr:hypothetical protein [Sphingomonas sp. PL-96]MCC2976494.1 hypothetical protein [Sphingomonas sp. PL-96]
MGMLLVVALLLAIPTYGLSFLPLAGAFLLRAWMQGSRPELQPAQNALPAFPLAQTVPHRAAAQHRSTSRPRPALPAWAKDPVAVERFRTDLLDALPNRGVPRPYVAAILSADETIALALAAARTAEESGRDFYRQCFATADFIVRRWNALAPAEQRAFQDRYR